jgi:hypothetical protein
MYKTISNKIIRKFNPCYDPSKYIKDENEELPVKEWVEKYRSIVPTNDIIWLLSRKKFMSKKDLILFVVWCAREALKLIANPDERSVNACNVAERYANGEATREELFAARAAAYDARDAVDIGNYTVVNDAVNISDSIDTYYTVLSAADATYYTDLSAANATYIATSYAVDHVDAYNVAHNAYNAAFYSAYTSYAVANDDYMDSYAAASDAAESASTSQLDQLLTYF